MRFVAVIRAAFLGLLIYTSQAPTLQAGIIPISQAQSIDVSGTVQVCVPDPLPENPDNCNITNMTISESKVASGFGLFDESISQLSTFSGGSAQQRSFISPLLVSAVGRASGGSAEVNHSTTSHSDFRLGFDVAETEIWRLTASISFGFVFDFSLKLSGPGGVIIDLNEFNLGFPPAPVDQLVTLTPGSYILGVNAGAGFLTGEGGGATYDVIFRSTIPEPNSAAFLALGAAVLVFLRRMPAR